MLRKFLDVSLVVVVVGLTGFSFFLYAHLRDFSQLPENKSVQVHALEQLKVEIKDLKDQLRLQKYLDEKQKAGWEEVRQDSLQVKGLLPQIKDSIAEIKSVIAQSRADVWKIKDDTTRWQKDYVSTLVDIQQKVNSLDQSLNSTSEIVDQGLPKILQEVDMIKEDIKKINKKVSDQVSTNALLKPLPPFDSRLP